MVKDVLCAASFCRKAIDKTIQFHPFPAPDDKMRLRMWQKRLLANMVPESSNAYACSRHFSKDQYVLNSAGRRIMKRNAIPDRNMVMRTRDPKDPLDAVCRFCLERSQMEYQMIFPVWPNPDVPTAADIADLFGIVITPDDLLPRIVCVTCTTKIKYMKRIRQQFQKNDAILRAKFANQFKKAPARSSELATERGVSEPSFVESGTAASKVSAVTPHPSPPPRLPQKPIVVEPNYSEADTAPKITAVASLGKNPVEVHSTGSGAGSDEVLQAAFGSVIYVQDGNTYQQFQIINSDQIMPPIGEHEEEVVATSTTIKEEPMDNTDLTEEIKQDTDMLYVEDREQVKIEYQQFDFGSMHSEDDVKLEVREELEEGASPQKKLRIDMPFRYVHQIKEETDET